MYFHGKGVEWDSSTATAAINSLDCLIYLHKNGCSWDEEACYCAASRGRLDCLVYLHENGCPWNEKAFYGAAYYRHLDCIRYLHENGCPWDEITFSAAINKESINDIYHQEKHDRNLYIDYIPRGYEIVDELKNITDRKVKKIVRYLIKHKCPGYLIF